MYSTQMCMDPCGKVRGKPPVRFAVAHSLQATHSLNMLLLDLIQAALAREHY